MKNMRGHWVAKTLPTFLVVSGTLLCLRGASLASSRGSGLDLLSCMASTDERLAECNVRGFSMADPALLQQVVQRAHFELENEQVPHLRLGFWGGIRHFSKFVYTGFRHFFVPKARAFLCMDQEDEPVVSVCDKAIHERESSLVKSWPALSGDEFEIDPAWAFEWTHDDASDTQARAWQRGHDRVAPLVSLEPDLQANRYGMSLDVRF